MSSLQGKGFWIWKVRDCEEGDPSAIAAAASSAGYTHVMVKIADGSYPYNIDRTTKADLVPPVVDALKARGMQVWGWHYVYGNSPVGEASIALQRLDQLMLDGYIIDAEIEYKEPGKANAARAFMERMRARFPNLPMALSSYRFPSFHPQFPWQPFLEKVDVNMPQVYWEQGHNAGAQLRRCIREFQAKTPVRPIIPTGPAYPAGGWSPTTADLSEFFETCQALGLPAANFFSWDECRARLPGLWDHIANYHWPSAQSTADITDLWIQALNSHNADRVMALYFPLAVHITAARQVQGGDAIRSWYVQLFNELLPNATFQLTSTAGTASSRHLNWTATSTKGKVTNGNDTFGLLNGKIAYHYSYFTINPA